MILRFLHPVLSGTLSEWYQNGLKWSCLGVSPFLFFGIMYWLIFKQLFSMINICVCNHPLKFFLTKHSITLRFGSSCRNHYGGSFGSLINKCNQTRLKELLRWVLHSSLWAKFWFADLSSKWGISSIATNVSRSILISNL